MNIVRYLAVVWPTRYLLGPSHARCLPVTFHVTLAISCLASNWLLEMGHTVCPTTTTTTTHEHS